MGTHIYVDIINGSKNFLQITRKLKLKLYRKEKIVQNDAVQHLLYIKVYKKRVNWKDWYIVH